mmetsp:Transcript_18684/g.52260  ORF Transcript_18684/g.52260 Transcript_18684/m.52260 type:complete len:308 (+) Transcript_18684:6844-7767(+)
MNRSMIPVDTMPTHAHTHTEREKEREAIRSYVPIGESRRLGVHELFVGHGTLSEVVFEFPNGLVRRIRQVHILPRERPAQTVGDPNGFVQHGMDERPPGGGFGTSGIALALALVDLERSIVRGRHAPADESPPGGIDATVVQSVRESRSIHGFPPAHRSQRGVSFQVVQLKAVLPGRNVSICCRIRIRIGCRLQQPKGAEHLGQLEGFEAVSGQRELVKGSVQDAGEEHRVLAVVPQDTLAEVAAAVHQQARTDARNSSVRVRNHLRRGAVEETADVDGNGIGVAVAVAVAVAARGGHGGKEGKQGE